MKKQLVTTPPGASVKAMPLRSVEDSFAEVLSLIESARQRAYQAVNTELVTLYWRIGEYISGKLESAEWGDGVVDQLARHLAQTQPGLRGFTRRNLFRMRQFHACYRHSAIVSPLVSLLPWTHHLLILSYAKREEEREFYIQMAIREKWGKRELERQMRSALFEKAILNPPKVSAALRDLHPQAAEFFKDVYALEFLSLPDTHSEADLHSGLLKNLGRFITELGRDFCFVGSEYPLQVGGQDFALDRDQRKPHENPAIGLLLCATKDEEVVEYAFSRSLSPALVAKYVTQLPDKQLLRAKLHEFYQLLTPPYEVPPISPVF